jgi:hypothetical protein
MPDSDFILLPQCSCQLSPGSSGQKNWGKKMSMPFRNQFRRPGAIFLPSIFLPGHGNPTTQRFATRKFNWRPVGVCSSNAQSGQDTS